MRQRPRVVVCGARFGQVYLEAFRNPELPFELAGVIAAGSERSRACARRYDAPLYTDPDQLPDDIDMACVVIRGGLLGGRGSELARALMARGIHVLQEHPLHHDELAENLRTARRHGVVYHLNPFYTHVAPVRRFVAAAQELLRRQRPLYIDAAAGFQLAYSLLDILGQSLGGVRPFAFGDLPATMPTVAAATRLDIPFRSLDGVLAGVPTTLRIQNQMDPADPDNYAHLMHRISIGTEAGNLTLVNTHGPVVWSARPDFPREVADPNADPHYATMPDDAQAPSAVVLGPATVPSYRHIFRSLWPAGIAHALTELHQAAEEQQDPLRRGQYHLSLCKLWQDLTLRLGPPELLSSTPPEPLTDDDLKAIAAAGDEAARP
ncbi:Gfo/Idh/MocA family oxidoreductase [Micromonospora fiedleri]|uniref:Gfo/Idh/MocA family oxidoreductase n=1 Tax=Micromonospora fiedleri TaxID=1157498 RepID=A0ABS1UTY5_9ACTN|nr:MULTISPECIES: Gfo/Idh/MocA family oxidoreductase [Micromonospora]MBL6279825.1 Gfo/Idh/MocA family oxidoreductase [Micromonospora fiedleri]WSK43684.1 Gfo/Idh/MocA family oxidoreductase [Micromonospora maris]